LISEYPTHFSISDSFLDIPSVGHYRLVDIIDIDKKIKREIAERDFPKK
jgi:hypothetical protein